VIFKLDKKGLETVLLPWQAELMRLIWGTGGEIDSRTAHNRLRNSTTPVSRASTINFLDRMAGEGFLDYRETTTKGGWKRVYRPSRVAPDEGGFRKALAARIENRVKMELLGEEGFNSVSVRLRSSTTSPLTKA
jgi:hypothetical protein